MAFSFVHIKMYTLITSFDYLLLSSLSCTLDPLGGVFLEVSRMAIKGLHIDQYVTSACDLACIAN